MRLIVLRHAEAEAGADMDAGRQLTSNGRRQAEFMRSRLVEQVGDYRLLSSPWQRALTTAEILAEGKTVPVNSELTPSSSLTTAATALESMFVSEQPLVVVTHQPLCGFLIHWLTEGRGLPLSVAPCSGALLELDWPAAGMARLVRWLDTAPSL